MKTHFPERYGWKKFRPTKVLMSAGRGLRAAGSGVAVLRPSPIIEVQEHTANFLCARGFAQVLLLVRNPLDAIDSHFNLVCTGSHEKSIAEGEYQRFAKEWDAMVRQTNASSARQRAERRCGVLHAGTTARHEHGPAVQVASPPRPPPAAHVAGGRPSDTCPCGWPQVRSEFKIWQRFHEYFLERTGLPTLIVRFEDLVSDKVRSWRQENGPHRNRVRPCMCAEVSARFAPPAPE